MYFFLLLYCFCGVCLSLVIGLNSTLFVNFRESLYGVLVVLFSSLRGAIFLKSFLSFLIFSFAVFSDFLLKIQQSVIAHNIQYQVVIKSLYIYLIFNSKSTPSTVSAATSTSISNLGYSFVSLSSNLLSMSLTSFIANVLLLFTSINGGSKYCSDMKAQNNYLAKYNCQDALNNIWMRLHLINTFETNSGKPLIGSLSWCTALSPSSTPPPSPSPSSSSLTSRTESSSSLVTAWDHGTPSTNTNTAAVVLMVAGDAHNIDDKIGEH